MLDIFANQNAEAKKRHASPSPPPPGVRRPATLANRRKQSPHALRTNNPGLEPESSESDMSLKTSLDSYDAHTRARREARAEHDEKENLRTPTSAELFADLRQAAPELMDGFNRHNARKNELVEGWFREYLVLKMEKDEKVKKLWQPEEENPEAVEKARLEKEKKLRESVPAGLGMPVNMRDSSDESGGSADATSANSEERRWRRRLARENELRDGIGPVRHAQSPPRPTRQPASKSTESSSPSGGGVPLPKDPLVLELQIKMRLLPALVFLANPQVTHDPQAVRKAKKGVRDAYYLARHSPDLNTTAGKALEGRCCFYQGMFRLVGNSQNDSRDGKAEKWFIKAAANAKGVYEEADWAESWARSLKGRREESRSGGGKGPQGSSPSSSASPMNSGSKISSAAAEQPKSAGSWVGTVWDLVARNVKGNIVAKPPPFAMLTGDPVAGHATNPALEGDQVSPRDSRPDNPDHIPSFSSQGSSQWPVGGASIDQDHHGGTWSQNHPFDEGGVSSEQGFTMFQPTNGFTGYEQEARAERAARRNRKSLPLSPYGGLVPIQDLSPGNFGSDRGKLGGELKVVDTGFFGVEPPPPPPPPQTLVNKLEQEQHSSPRQVLESPPPPERKRYVVVNGSPPTDSSSSGAHSGAPLPTPDPTPSYQPPQQHDSPKTSPRKSVVFSALDKLPFSNKDIRKEDAENQPSPTSSSNSKGIFPVGRRLSRALSGSISAIATSWVPDKLALAGEGQSPFRSTFGGEGEGLKQRKRSEPEDMV